jgi:hypothetical protein
LAEWEQLGERRIKDEEPKQKERKNERKGLTLTGLLMEGVSDVSDVSVIQHNLKRSLPEAMK